MLSKPFEKLPNTGEVMPLARRGQGFAIVLTVVVQLIETAYPLITHAITPFGFSLVHGPISQLQQIICSIFT